MLISLHSAKLLSIGLKMSVCYSPEAPCASSHSQSNVQSQLFWRIYHGLSPSCPPPLPQTPKVNSVDTLPAAASLVVSSPNSFPAWIRPDNSSSKWSPESCCLPFFFPAAQSLQPPVGLRTPLIYSSPLWFLASGNCCPPLMGSH